MFAAASFNIQFGLKITKLDHVCMHLEHLNNPPSKLWKCPHFLPPSFALGHFQHLLFRLFAIAANVKTGITPRKAR